MRVASCVTRTKALMIAQGLGIGAFKASSNWLWRWKCRWDVGMRRSTSCSQRVPADYQVQLVHFRRTIVRHREVNGYALSNIANMDQTMVRFDSAPKCTNNIRGMKSIRIATTGGEKRGFTVSLCACADGRKLPALIIFKERNGVLGRRVRAALRYPDNVRVTASTNGWMTKERLLRWIQDIWSEAEDGERRLLVLDHYKPHRAADTGSLIQSLDTDLVFHLPAYGCFGQCSFQEENN